MKLKILGAVAAGLGANLLALPVDAVLLATGVFPAPGEDTGESGYVLALAYRTAFAVVGGWVTGRFAPSSPIRHAVVLGVFGVIFASLGAAAQWELGHHWYPLSLVAISLPATLIGAHLFTRSQP